MTRTSRLITWTCAGLLVLGVCAILGGRAWLYSHLRSGDFRQTLNTSIGRTLHARAEFSPLNFAGFTAHSDGFSADGKSGAAFGKMRADQVRAEFDWRGLFERKLRIEELSVQRFEVHLGEQAPAAIEPDPGPRDPSRGTLPSRKKSWEIELRRALVRETRLSWGDAEVPRGEFSGSTLTVTPSGSGWRIEAQGGRLAQTGWPVLALDSARLRWQEPSLFISDAVLRNGDGRVTVAGEVEFGRAADLQIEWSAVEVTPLLAGDWKLRLFGVASGSAKLFAPLGSERGKPMRIEGTLRLANGRLEALPVLNQIAAFTRTQRFRQMPLTNASVKFEREGSRLSARDLVLESAGLMRVEGSFHITDRQIDGAFQVGVTPASLQWLPGTQERVFTVARDGYLWTPMRLTGPVEAPVEDLSARLAVAVGEELFHGGEGVLQDAEQKVNDAARSVLDLLLR